VTDSTGLTASTSVTVFPEKVDLSFDSLPSGMTVQVDGINRQTPFILDTLIGFHHTISAPDQVFEDTPFAFAGWSDRGARSHEIIVPASDQTYVATFEASQTSGLVAAYGFEEGSGGAVADLSDFANHGTIVNATWSTAGRFGNALSFNGSNALVAVNDADSLDLTTAMTLEAWVRPSAVTSAWRDVIYKGDDQIYYLSATSTTQGRPATGGTYVSDILFGPSTLPVNTWSHLAATYDGSMMRLYVDGVQVASHAQTGPIHTSNGALTIGQNFAGRIDEVRIYNRALSLAEIQEDRDTPVPAVDLAGDYNTDQAVNAADYVVWRKFLGSAATVPNDATPPGVTNADYHAWTSNFGETELPAVALRGPTPPRPDAAATGLDAAPEPMRVAGMAAGMAMPQRRQRPSVGVHGPRDVALTPSIRDSLLRVHPKTSVKPNHSELSAQATERQTIEESHDVVHVSSFDALDNVFAELGRTGKSRRHAR
jgi:hypothetical protein